MHKKTEFVPAKRKVVVVFLAVLVGAVLLFALLLRFTLGTACRLNPDGYTLQTPAGFQFKAEDSLRDGILFIEGWAVVEGERFESVNTRVVLYNPEAQSYLRLPTTMVERKEVLALFAKPLNYHFGGFEAQVSQNQLDKPLAQYEICFAYQPNQYHHLIHTGQFLGVA